MDDSRVIPSIAGTLLLASLGYVLAPKGYKLLGAAIGVYLGFRLGTMIGESLGKPPAASTEPKPLKPKVPIVETSLSVEPTEQNYQTQRPDLQINRPTVPERGADIRSKFPSPPKFQGEEFSIYQSAMNTFDAKQKSEFLKEIDKGRLPSEVYPEIIRGQRK